ncbi:uncharacterized protein LOC126687959 [Mercurialis annua]|uniref:uncharacterized protein LOC126687959 n=1 Tax=Mercurialis annua TaxID=3986 RepID=UPI0024AE49CB|nr:uncharacterized protein LOC126687959 [Mercurialis annua]
MNKYKPSLFFTINSTNIPLIDSPHTVPNKHTVSHKTQSLHMAPSHENAKLVFGRMINLGRAVEASIRVIVFWMWLETQGFGKIIQTLISYDDNFLTAFSDEADAILSYINSISPQVKPIPSNLMRLTVLSSKRFLTPQFLFADKEKVLNGVANVLSEYRALFEDTLKEMSVEVDKLENLCYNRSAETEIETEKNGVEFSGIESKLNPFAKEWSPETDRISEDDRCLFLTFSNGYPLTEMQLVKFFNETFGECVEKVYVHWPNPRNRRKVPPLFGKVVFKSYYITTVILNGRKEAKFWAERKPLWCKRFDPTKKIVNHD